MLSKADDQIFVTDDVHAVFDTLPGGANGLAFWPGDHNDWLPELIDASISFLQQHLPPC